MAVDKLWRFLRALLRGTGTQNPRVTETLSEGASVHRFDLSPRPVPGVDEGAPVTAGADVGPKVPRRVGRQGARCPQVVYVGNGEGCPGVARGTGMRHGERCGGGGEQSPAIDGLYSFVICLSPRGDGGMGRFEGDGFAAAAGGA